MSYVLLGAKTDWAAADLASSANYYIGPNATGTGFTVSTTEASVSLFDTRPFKQLVLFWTGTFANAVTLEMDIRVYTDNTTATFVGATFATTAANGGPMVIAMGVGTNVAAGASDAAFNVVHSYSPLMPPAVRLKFFNSAATGVITAGTLFLYGIT